MNKLLPYRNVLIIRRRGTGKSVLVRDILYHKRHIPNRVVYSGTDNASPFYSKFIPKSFVKSNCDPKNTKYI